jgi:hypothetical protein
MFTVRKMINYLYNYSKEEAEEIEIFKGSLNTGFFIWGSYSICINGNPDINLQTIAIAIDIVDNIKSDWDLRTDKYIWNKYAYDNYISHKDCSDEFNNINGFQLYGFYSCIDNYSSDSLVLPSLIADKKIETILNKYSTLSIIEKKKWIDSYDLYYKICSLRSSLSR